MSSGRYEYTSNLAEFVCKTIKRWAQDKSKSLEPKLRRNFEAVTNQDYRTKSWKTGEAKDWRSQSWIGFVRVKVWSFFSLFLDTVMQAGKIPFVLNPSPYDETWMPPEMIEDRDARIDKMTAKIESQLAARNADREYMKKWLSLGYYGMAFSKFNIQDVESTEFKLVLPGGVDIRQATQFLSYQEIMQYARHEMVTEAEAVPGHKYVSVWNMVWDMDSDFGEGEGVGEHIKSSPYDLRQLRGPGYLPDAIEKVIEENKDNKDGSSSDQAETPGKAALTERKKTISRYEFYMRVPEKYANQFEREITKGGGDVAYLRLIQDIEETETSGKDVEIMGEIAGKEIIRYIRNETGKQPYKMSVLEQNLDETTGTGIADNMESVQESLVGMIRSFEDNKKLSANVTTALKKRYFNNPDQTKLIQPGTQLEIADSCDDVRKAVLPIVFPDVGESLMSGIQLMLQLKDDVSMIPTILQGFTLPKHKPDTAFEMQQLTANAGKYMGQGIRNNDEQFIEPEINEIYEYNMIYGDDESCKVNGKIKANGFTSYQNKELRGARMQQALGMMMASELLAPYCEVKPHLEIIYSAMDEDPEKFIKSEEKMAQEAQQRMEQEAQQQAKALQLAQAQSNIETNQKLTEQQQDLKNKLIENKQEHEHDMIEEDQKHEHRLVETLSMKGIEDDKKTPKEATS